MTDYTLSDVFTALNGPANAGRVMGVGSSTASEMKRNGSIAVKYWPSLIEWARENGKDWLTYEALVHMHARKVEAPPATAA